ncbi:MAG: PEP-CTERM sorting domain-containing protein [Akkermansia sp.]
MKTISATFLAFAGMAWAANTQVFDLTTSVTSSDSPSSPYFYDSTNGRFTDNTSISGTVLNETNNANQIQTNISFVLNLTEAMKVTSTTTLLLMDMNAGDVGLCLTTTGVASTWEGKTSASRKSVTYTSLLQDKSVFTDTHGNQCITLTMVQTYASGIQLYSNNSQLFNDAGLRASGNTALTSVTLGTAYVEAVQFSPGWLTSEAAWKTKNKTFDTAARLRLEAVPEPATATLSLLALVVLAARRRRA